MDALPNAAAFPGHKTSMTDGPIRDGDDQDELPLEQQPIFTEQDEQRELATLTTQELMELRSDLTGIPAITYGFSGLGSLGLGLGSAGINVHGGESPVSRGSSPPRPLSTHLLLAALDQHMMTLPAQSTAAYFRATTVCPDQVSEERKLMFLQCEENNVPLAADRLALYWQYRLNGFGEDRCFEPMTLDGAMMDEITNMAKSGVVQLMPNTDAAGRAIIYFRMDKRDYALYSVQQEVMWLTYLLEIVVQHQSLQSRGFVCLFNASNVTRKHYTRQAQQYRQRALDYAFPIRHRSNHGCNLSPLANYILVPVAMRLKSKNMRLRSRVHRGSGEDLLRSLAEFNLPRDSLPSDVGGRVVLDIKQFVLHRLSLEASRAGIHLQPAEEESSPDGQSNRAGTTHSSAAQHHNGHGQAPPIHGPSVGAAAGAVSRGTKGSSKRSGPRNIVDPRMAKAVRAKQDDQDLSLYESLISGGFSFTNRNPNGSGSTDHDFVDENDVSLKQRKNNLCRRLREEQKKKTKRARKTGDGGTASVTRNIASVAAMGRHDSLDEGGLGSPGRPDDKDVASILLHFKRGT